MSSEKISYLFVPADSERKIIKAFDSKADALIFDLEDGVMPAAKCQAREILLRSLESKVGDKRGGKQLVIRYNPVGSCFFVDDLVAIRNSKADAIMIPKCEDASDIQTVEQALPDLKNLPLIESARGVLRLEKILEAGKNILRVAFGAVDFASDLRVSWSAKGVERSLALAQLVLISRALSLEAPLGAVYPALDSRIEFEAEAHREKMLGFHGKMTIHPRQLEWLAGVYQVSLEEQNWSRRVVEAFEASGASGAFELDGKLIDLPVYEIAKRLLERNSQL